MSNSPNFFVQGKIDTHSDVYIVAKTSITSRNGNITPANVFKTNQVTGNDTMWSVLGAQQQYTPYEDLKDNVYYHYTNGSYYYPLKVYNDGDYTNEFKLDNYGTLSSTSPTMTLYTNVEILGGVPTPPQFSNEYINCESLFELPLIVTSDSGHHFPLFLNKNTNPSHNTPTTTLERVFYYSGANLPVVATVPTNPAKLMLGNPYQTPMNNLFRIEQSTKENQGMSITLSSGIGNPSITKFKNITIDKDTDVLSCSDTGESLFFNFEPQDVNIDNVHLYAGVGYKLKPSESVSKTPKLNIMGNVTKDSTIIKTAGIEYPETSVPSDTSFLINYGIIDKNYNGTLQKLDDTTTTLYFIPNTMYQISTSGRLEYLGYTPIEMLLTSPQMFNVGPKIRTGSLAAANTNYFKWVDTVEISTSKSELAFTTGSHTASSRLVTRYCNVGEFCGKCQGKCHPSNILNNSSMCILDTKSQSEFAKGDDYFTCDQERFLDSSDYSKKGPFTNHSTSFIVIVIVAAVVIIAGFVLFEERKMILKHTLNLKNGHHHTH